ncbi:MAG: FAD-binding oxidoreductase, partial [Acetobacteraceae bacterium]|nr:FAD-binding oxidoreductase [Acetobacteraceae bacterium]
MKVVVIGAGVVGSSIGYRLAEAGAAVTVLDAGRVGGGTSACSFAWTNSHRGDVPVEYHALRVASMRLYPELQRQFGDAPWFHQTGNVEWGRPGLEENVRNLQGRGYRAEWIGRERLLELEPGVDPAAVGDETIAWYPDDGWVDPV